MRPALVALLAALALVAGAGAGEGEGGTGSIVHRRFTLGTSVLGRPIPALEAGDPTAKTRVVVVCCIHGDEDAGLAVVQELEQMYLPPDVDLWLVENVNPDGVAAGTRVNAHSIDLNRNFPWHWRKHGRKTEHWSGPRPLSEPESRALARLLLRVRPKLVLWYHQALAVTDLSGGNPRFEQEYAHLSGLALKRLPRYPGSAVSWANRHIPGATSFVVELPPGDLGTAAAIRQASAVLALAQGVAAAA
jgi:protein MpaA